MRDDIDLPRVAADNQLIGRVAAEHFAARGFRRCLWVPFQDDVPNRERSEGFQTRLAELGVAVSELATTYWAARPGGFRDWAARRRIVSEILKDHPKPVAVFCYNDCVAADIIGACSQAGIMVPAEVAVLGVDDDSMLCESVNTPLSSVRHDLETDRKSLFDQGAATGRPVFAKVTTGSQAGVRGGLTGLPGRRRA